MDKLKRYGIDVIYSQDGPQGLFVLASEAEAREKALVIALRDVASGAYSHDACVRARAILARYDAEQRE